MKKLLLAILLAVIFSNAMAVEKGDSLAILNYRVWVYENPDVLKTRHGPYSYYDRRMVYLGTNDTFSDYYKVLTPDDIVAYVKTKNVSAEKELTHKKIKADIKAGLRSKSLNDIDYGKFADFTSWEYWVGLLAWLTGLYYLWKYFYKIESWFYRKVNKAYQKTTKNNFLSASIILGVIIGGSLGFNTREGDWFLSEGIRLWAEYPSYWDWFWWFLFLTFSGLLIAAVAGAFLKFNTGLAIGYSAMLLPLMIIYFATGFFIGWIVAVIVILITVLYALGQGGKSDTNRPNTIYQNGKTYDWVSGNTYKER